MSIFILIGVASIILGIYEICKEKVKWHRFKKKLHAARPGAKRRMEVYQY